MSVTVQQILNDAKKLVTRLRERDSAVDSVLADMQSLHKTVESSKEYNEKISELNSSANQRPRSALILNIQQENRHIRELQQENRELRTLLEEHQSTLELIMSKYRQQVTELVRVNDAEKLCKQTEDSQKDLHNLDKVWEMIAIMKKAVDLDAEDSMKEHEWLTEIVTENKGLKELLAIGNKCGSIKNLVSPDTCDKEVQTDTL